MFLDGVQATVAAVAAVRSFGAEGASDSTVAAVGRSAAEGRDGALEPCVLAAVTVTVKGPPSSGSPPIRREAGRL